MPLFGPLVSLAYSVVPFLVIITIVVFFHELGHFLVARWCGVKVDAFSIGFGPELAARIDRKGTRWRLAAIPLGGYVKFHGDMDPSSFGTSDIADQPGIERTRTFLGQPVAKRAAIVAAGPIANFILAFVVLTGLIYMEGQPSAAPRVGALITHGAAERAGFVPGDLITSIDGQPIRTFAEIHDAILHKAGVPVRFDIERDGRPMTLTATPDAPEMPAGAPGPRPGVLGVKATMKTIALPKAAERAGEDVWAVVAGTAHYVGGLVMGREKADQLSGPIGIASVAGQAARMGLATVLNVVALLSVSIGLINLMPVPLLDGGHLLYFAFEALRGRPMSVSAQEFGFKVGLALVSMLMIFATYNDVSRYFLRG